MSDDPRFAWNDDALEPRGGRVTDDRYGALRIAGCSPRRGDWIRVGDTDTLVLKVEKNGWIAVFPPRFPCPYGAFPTKVEIVGSFMAGRKE